MMQRKSWISETFEMIQSQNMGSLCNKSQKVREVSSLFACPRLDFQPLFGKRARAPPLFSGRNVDRTRESGGNRAYACPCWWLFAILLCTDLDFTPASHRGRYNYTSCSTWSLSSLELAMCAGVLPFSSAPNAQSLMFGSAPDLRSSSVISTPVSSGRATAM